MLKIKQFNQIFAKICVTMLSGINKLLNNPSITRSCISYRCCSEATQSKQSTEKWIPVKVKPLGQPTSDSHPHLVKPGEISPGIKISEFQTRRVKLMQSILEHATKYDKNQTRHLVVIPSATKKYMSDKIPYVFRQNTDFLYLSGCLEPDTCLVLSGDMSNICTTMFVRPKNGHSEMWEGPRTGIEAAPSLFGIDQALSITDFVQYIDSFIRTDRNFVLWYDYMNPTQPTIDKTMRDKLNETVNRRWESPIPFVQKLRLIKSPAEIILMQQSCDIASEAIVEAIKMSRPGCTEHQIFAKVDYECRMHGAEYLAYPPVIAGGDRACVIHYTNNNQVVSNGETVLMDAGCEYHGYSSDITRTWPINGRFSEEQRILYEIVYEVQCELLKLCSSFPTLDNLFDSMCVGLGKKLQRAGLIPKQTSSKEVTKLAFQFCPHHVSHYLGMDVHDTGYIPRNINIKPGMIITVEPGIYITDRHNVPAPFRGLGVRIEDDVLITENGPVLLTSKCPRQLSDVEAIARRNVSL